MEWHLLDHAASSPVRPAVADALIAALRDEPGNPSGAHALARRARDVLDDARARLATVVGCRPGEVVFTSGGTEADNLAVRGVLGARGGTVLCGAGDHHAVLHVVERSDGRAVSLDERGLVDLAALASQLDDEVTLVSVVLVNNEVGTVQDLAALRTVLREHAPRALLHADAAQALPWLDVAHAAAPADLVTLSSHKCGGPKGVGALIVRDGVTIEAQQVGGGQERDRRSGTQDVAGAVGFAVAAEEAAAGRDALVARAARWRADLVGAVLAALPGAVESAVPGGGDRRHVVPGIVDLCLPEVDSEALLFLLEHDHGVLASAGSSCASGAQDPSHVLAALGIPRELARGSLRLSFGWSTTDDDVRAAIDGVPAAVARLQAHARNGAPA